MTATVPSPNDRASIAARAVASGPGGYSSPAARSIRSAGSVSCGRFELTGSGLGRLVADLGERRGHARVELIDERIDVLPARRRKRTANHHVDIAVGEGVHCFLDRTCVPEAVGHDVVNGALGTLQNEPEPATHEGQDGSV